MAMNRFGGEAFIVKKKLYNVLRRMIKNISQLVEGDDSFMGG